MNPSFSMFSHPPRRRTVLLCASIFPFLLTGCAKVIPDTKAPIYLEELLEHAQQDIILVLAFLQLSDHINPSDQVLSYLKETLRVRREQEKFLINASHSTATSIQADHLPPIYDPAKLNWKDIPAQLHQSSEHAKNLCFQTEGEISAISASICASCAILTSLLSHI